MECQVVLQQGLIKPWQLMIILGLNMAQLITQLRVFYLDTWSCLFVIVNVYSVLSCSLSSLNSMRDVVDLLGDMLQAIDPSIRSVFAFSYLLLWDKNTRHISKYHLFPCSLLKMK